MNLLCIHFKVSKERVITSSPYKGYAVYLARKHTPLSNAEIGSYFGKITYSAATKIGTRLKERIRENERVRGEMRELEGRRV